VISDTANDSYYNGLMLLGKERSLYLKRHLVVFGEYYPMRWLLDFLRGFINIPYSDLTSGPGEQELMKVKDTILGLSICFEDAFSRDVLMALPEANLLVNVSNDAWFGDSTAPHQHLQMAQMRSQETGRAMVRSTNTGVSAFIDYRGKIIAQSEQFRTQSISLTLSGRSGVTPFFYFAKVQGALAVFALLVILILAWRKAV
jgi:apolipoprotein N-acyltransferase